MSAFHFDKTPYNNEREAITFKTNKLIKKKKDENL